MPATFVVKTSGPGSLEGIQVGPTDIVATVAAAHSAWGWIGGITGIQNLFQCVQNPSEEKKLQQLYKEIDLPPASCLVVAQNGVNAIPLQDNNVFGDSLSSKLIGLTICALGYNMKLDTAIRVFMSCLVDNLFQRRLSKLPGSKEALHALLVDNGQIILNAGAIHHLPEAFEQAIAALHMKSPRKPAEIAQYKTPTETLMVHGFLNWLTAGSTLPYWTRSAVVTRIAACLKTVGYSFDDIVLWDGCGERPTPSRSLILVTGGTHQTDQLMHEDLSDTGDLDLVSHYRWETVGALLWNAVKQPSNHVQESFQQDFESIDAAVSHCLDFRWAKMDQEQSQIQAFPVWKASASKSSHIAIRLATILFHESVDYVAVFYERIANEKYLEAAKTTMKPNRRGLDLSNKEIQRFQVISAAVCFAVLAQLAGRSFRNLQHSTMIDLSKMYGLNWLCSEVDTILTGDCTFSRVVTTVAAIHCAKPFPHVASGTLMSLRTMEFESSGESASSSELGNSYHTTNVIGWRSGRYAVLPELLFALEKPLTRSVLGLRCASEFIANIPTRQNGAVRSPLEEPHFNRSSDAFTEEVITEGYDIEAQQISAHDIRPIILGRPRLMEPDKPLYINLERQTAATNEAAVGLCGRLDGESLGFASITTALAVIANSMNNADGQPYHFCHPGEDHKTSSEAADVEKVFNMAPSAYFYRSPSKRTHCGTDQLQHPIYIQVARSTPWTVFLAGAHSFDRCVVFGCPGCAINTGSFNIVERREKPKYLIGYQ